MFACMNRLCLGAALLFTSTLISNAEDALHRFERKQLTGTYYSEGANAGDLDQDGVVDIVYGPHWYAGPDYDKSYEIYKAVPQNMNGYADNFFNWVHDFDGDGLNDVLVAGFPGTPAFVYQNPGKENHNQPWPKHQVFNSVGNESPQLVDVDGDKKPELVCTRDGFFGYVTVNWDNPFGEWNFHPISEQITAKRFGHGLGIGDVNGDGRQDIIHPKGWFEQPETNADSQRWFHHEVNLAAGYGGAEMYAYDVDGDGDNDIITSDQAHEYGLSWYEHKPSDDGISFERHIIVGNHPSESKYGILFTEPHSVALADIDGDGLKDIITGKTYWSHHKKSPMWDAGAVVYWFRLTRTEEGVDWVPYLADHQAGIGRQVSIADVNDDGLLDIVVGGMKGAHVLIHQRETVTPKAWKAAQPKPYQGPKLPSMADAEAKRGEKSSFAAGSDRVASAIEGESLAFSTTGGSAKAQPMGNFKDDRWSGKSQLWWTGGKPGDRLTVELPEFTGTVDFEIVLTCAIDYGVVQLFLNDKKLGNPVDLMANKVITTGVLSFPKLAVDGKKHQLHFQIAGANPAAVKGYMVGLDYVRIRKPDGSYVAGTQPVAKPDVFSQGERPKDINGKTLNLDFETGTLEDWAATGNAFKDQPIKGDTVNPRRSTERSNHAGEFWIGGYEAHGDEGMGTLTSAPFVVSQPYASFLSNGGRHQTTRVELIRKDATEPFARFNGTEVETMRRMVVDLRPYVGKEIMIRLVDQHAGGWGHLNFDDFRLHEKRPAKETSTMVVLKQDQYPHSGLDAQAAAAAMKLPIGFSVQVGAAEPAVKQPIAMAIDDRGRVWIAEAYEYPRRASGDKGRDRILIFEDTDNDGSLDSKKVFAEGLNLVSGLEVGFGGVWVGAAPYFMFIPDRDGDDVPDSEPQILLDGWGYQDTHETLNAFIWGPDGWLYGCHGVFTHSKVGKPGTPDDQRIPLNCAVWRYHPLEHQFEVFAHGTSNPWGVDFNDQGQAFITACVIPHLYHIIQGARYQRQGGRHFNPYTYQDIVTIADHLHYLGSTPHGGNSKSDSAGGGHAHAGAMVYLGGHWPKEYRNQIFMNNIHGQRLNVDQLKPDGSGYIGSHSPDFLLTGDKASQILNLRYGPDGNAWMIDWYDMQACHHGDYSRHDRSNGRVYKINYGDKAFSSPKVDLANASDLELAKLVLDPNDWYVRHSRRLLQERSAERSIDDDALAFLLKTLNANADETRRLRAAWALHATRNLSDAVLTTMLGDASPYVRGWAVQLAMQSSNDQPSATLLKAFAKLAAEDDSQVTRLYLASACGRLPLSQRWDILSNLASHAEDATDHNLPLMYWYAAEPLAEEDGTRALAFAISAGEQIPLLRDFMLRRIGSDGKGSALTVLVAGLEQAKNSEQQRAYLTAIRTALKGQRSADAPANWSSVAKKLLQSDARDVLLQTTALGVTFGDETALRGMRDQIADASGNPKARLLALQSLLDANDQALLPTLQKLLGQSKELREAAIRGMAQYNDPQVATALLGSYKDFDPAQRRMALGTLCSRVNSGRALLAAIEEKQIAGSDLTADLVRQLQFFDDQAINGKLEQVWGTARESAAEKVQLIERYTKLVEATTHPQPDEELGRAIFAKTCMKCHQLYGQGIKLGPDLTGSNRANLPYLLSNIVDPSAVMAKEYQATTVLTADGRVVSGLLKEETTNAITIQTPDATVTVPLDEIDLRKLSDKSMMPDDQLKQFSEHEVRSLIQYLRGSGQTAMLANEENVASFFNKVDLTGWSGDESLWTVENGELVGKTNGLDHNEWIVSDLAVQDFKLSLEVKLVDNQGNSGIQFRSKSNSGEVSGYQADIGAGWWGKLYEEHGRALLWDKSGEEHVQPGEWNRYEVIARGDQIQTYINGQLCVDMKDPEGAKRGIIALQLHSGGPTEVRFRNLQLEVLKWDGD